MPFDNSNLYGAIEKMLVCDSLKAIKDVLNLVKENLSNSLSKEDGMYIKKAYSNYAEIARQASEYILESHNFQFLNNTPISSYIKNINWQSEQSSKQCVYIDKLLALLDELKEKIRSFSSGSTPASSIETFIRHAAQYLCDAVLDDYTTVFHKCKNNGIDAMIKDAKYLCAQLKSKGIYM